MFSCRSLKCVACNITQKVNVILIPVDNLQRNNDNEQKTKLNTETRKKPKWNRADLTKNIERILIKKTN